MHILIAGAESVRTTLDWAFMLMARHQDVQAKVQSEIESVVGHMRSVSARDRESLPYTYAVICEVHRWAAIAPINLPRCASADVTIDGTLVARGTTVLVNFWSVNRDVNIWPEPEKFDPTRFYDANNKIDPIIRRKELSPFSIGRRDCVGRTLAELQLIALFASVLQMFKVEPEDGVELSFEGFLGLSLVPKTKPTLKFTPRFDEDYEKNQRVKQFD